MENTQYPYRKSKELFSQNNVNLFEFFNGKHEENNKKLKKERELYIKENSKKILGGNAYGKNDRRI